MGKTKTLAAQTAREAPGVSRNSAGADGLSADDIYGTVMALFRQSRSRKRRPYNMRRAIAAFERMSGCVSHGSLAQNIDDELYGPMR
jgi:hypothetical protein